MHDWLLQIPNDDFEHLRQGRLQRLADAVQEHREAKASLDREPSDFSKTRMGEADKFLTEKRDRYNEIIEAAHRRKMATQL